MRLEPQARIASHSKKALLVDKKRQWYHPVAGLESWEGFFGQRLYSEIESGQGFLFIPHEANQDWTSISYYVVYKESSFAKLQNGDTCRNARILAR
jgi:hypothetical protein|mmetsp:Transcript_1839/g.3282  ORF Transcript_1839/g.3282 Transcript_1839/m.3282 type:complete len:96 (-) Transcript_1839:630-917(-)